MPWYTKALLSAAAILGLGGSSLLANPHRSFFPPVRPVPVVPVFPRPVVNPVLNPSVRVIIVPSGRARKALERLVEDTIRLRLGVLVEDVDVDIERDGDVEIEVESRHPNAFALVQAVACSIPQLQGLRLKIDIDD